MIHVLIASDDAGFRRLAAMALVQAGHTVRTATIDPARFVRLIAAGPTDVVVVDTVDAAEELRIAIASLDAAIGVVHVKEEGSLGVTKWGPLAALVAEVQISAEQATVRSAPPHLRIVS